MRGLQHAAAWRRSSAARRSSPPHRAFCPIDPHARPCPRSRQRPRRRGECSGEGAPPVGRDAYCLPACLPCSASATDASCSQQPTTSLLRPHCTRPAGPQRSRRRVQHQRRLIAASACGPALPARLRSGPPTGCAPPATTSWCSTTRLCSRQGRGAESVGVASRRLCIKRPPSCPGTSCPFMALPHAPATLDAAVQHDRDLNRPGVGQPAIHACRRR